MYPGAWSGKTERGGASRRALLNSAGRSDTPGPGEQGRNSTHDEKVMSPPSDAADRLREALRSRFGFDSFRPGQEEAAAAVLAGRDLVAVMPTGSGKSLCFQLPALLLDGTTVVVSPLIALMKDQVDGLKARGFAVAAVHSGLGAAERAAAETDLASGRLRVV